MKIIFYSHANKTHYHKKGFALRLVSKVRVVGNRNGLFYALQLKMLLTIFPVILNQIQLLLINITNFRVG